MPKIIQLSPHIANLIAAGEVVERPASVAKELLENAVDAGATKVTIEIRDGGMTFLRVTDNGCGMTAQDARTAFLRHATSKLHSAEDLASIGTMGFRGEALAAIASVSRIDLLTKVPEDLVGVSLHLEGGEITEETEAGCPDGTTIIIRNLFYNTPARMKFMKADTVEGSRVTSAVQLQALAHPQVAIQLIKDGKTVLSTPGSGALRDAVYCVYGRDFGNMVPVDSQWEKYRVTGFVCKPTDARPSRNLQTFFVNHRPVKSKLLVAALEEAYRNQLMVGKFPTCVLCLELPPTAVDVNVHPAKTEVKFLNEKAVFDCVHYGVLGALNKTPDRPEIHFAKKPDPQASGTPAAPAVPKMPDGPKAAPKKDFFRTMNAEEYRNFSQVLKDAPQPKQEKAQAVLQKLPQSDTAFLHSQVILPSGSPAAKNVPRPHAETPKDVSPIPPVQESPVPVQAPLPKPEPIWEEPEQVALEMPKSPDWRMVGELYRTYILVEQGDEAYLIDKHAAHERILFDKLKANQETIVGQSLLAPVAVRLEPKAAAAVMDSLDMLAQLGFELEEFGENTLLLRQIPMDLTPDDAASAVESLADDLLRGKTTQADTVRDEMLHTVACKAAIKAGWVNDDKELLEIVKQVMAREDLKYCPHGRPICITLSKKQLEKQFKRT